MRKCTCADELVETFNYPLCKAILEEYCAITGTNNAKEYYLLIAMLEHRMITIQIISSIVDLYDGILEAYKQAAEVLNG
jgi:hypothetical protein